MKNRIISILMALAIVISSVPLNNCVVHAADSSSDASISMDSETDADMTETTESTEKSELPEEKEPEEDVSETDNTDSIDNIEEKSEENINDAEDSSETEAGNEVEAKYDEEVEASDSEELSTYDTEEELEVYEAQTDAPDYDVWLSDTVVSGLTIDGTTYGNALYDIYKDMQEPIYAELGGLILDEVPLMAISSVWNDVIKKDFYDNQKLIYETLLLDYIKYENTTNASSFNASQLDRANGYLVKIFNLLAKKYLDEGVQNWSPEQFMNMSVEDAAKSFAAVESMQEEVNRVQKISKNAKELLTFVSNLAALNDAKDEKVQLIKKARAAAAGMANPNKDFISACDEIISQIESQSFDIEYFKTQAASKVMDKLINNVWSELADENPVLKAVDLGSKVMDTLFKTSDAASNNLKLSILYTMDCYFKTALSNASSQYHGNKTDADAAKVFNGCFEGYLEFQMYGNEVAKSWIGSVTDGGVLKHAFTYIFYRENLKNASELKDLCDSQNKTRSQILTIFGRYQDVYSNTYMTDEYKEAMSVPVTPAPVIDPKDYHISDGLTSPKPVIASGTCGDAAFWKLFSDGVMMIFGEGTISRGEEWGKYVDKITAMEIVSDAITKIEMDTFRNCNQIKSMSIPDSVTMIGNNAFSYCTNLESIKLSNNLKTLGSEVFSNCTSLKEITIPKGLNAVNNPFQNSSIEVVHLETGTTKICDSEFYCASHLKTVEIPEGVTEIGGYAFAGTSIEAITLPSTLTAIGSKVFQGSPLKNITIPNGVTSIGDNTFKNCLKLESINLSNNLETLGREVFSNCTSLKEITVPKSLTDAFSAFEDSKIEVAHIEPGTTKIYNSEFYCASYLKTVEIPEGVTEIGGYAFAGTSIKTITLPSTLKAIGPIAFRGSSLKSITIPDSVTSIGDNAFKNCTKLESIKLSNNLESLGREVFSNCTNLKEITIPKSLTGAYLSFYDSKIEVAHLEVGTTKIYGAEFYGAHSLKTVEIPEGVTDICMSALGGTAIETIALPSTLTTIGWEAFQGSTLKTITIPDNVTAIGDKAFTYCTKLESVKLSNNLETLEKEVFSNCTSLQKIIIPSSVNTIWDSAFWYCNQLTIYGYSNSYAETFAKEKNIPFESLEEEPDNITGYIPSVNGWGFSNYDVSTISEDLFYRVFDSSKLYNKHLYALKKGQGKSGLCEGLALTSALTYMNTPSVTTFNKIDAKTASDFEEGDKFASYSSDLKMSLNEFIQSLWLYQFSKESSVQEKNNKNKYQQIVDKTKAFSLTGKNPIAISISGLGKKDNKKFDDGTYYYIRGGHVLIPYKVEETSDKVKIYVYDCNSISINEDPDDQYIEMTKNSSGKITGWSYELWPGLTWGSSEVLGSITYCENFHVISSILDAGSADITENNALLTSDSSKFSIQTKDGSVIKYDNGYISGDDENELIPLSNNGIIPDGSVDSTATGFYLNENSVLKIDNDTKEEVSTSFFGSDYGVTMKSDGASTFNVTSTKENLVAKIAPGNTNTAVFVCENKTGSTTIETTTDSEVTSTMDATEDSVQVDGSTGTIHISFENEDGQTEEREIESDNSVKIENDGGEIIVKEDTNGDGEYDTVIEDSEKHAHSWNDGVITKRSTCVAEGTKTYTCKTCGDTYEEVIPVDKNTHVAIAVLSAKAATCTATGLTEGKQCNDCKTVLTAQKTIPALSHSFGNWTTTKVATVVATGVQTRTCSRCGQKETRVLAKLPSSGSLNATNFPLKVKQSATLKINGMAAGDRVASWKSANTTIATVDGNGKVTGKKKGNTTITATLASGRVLTATVKVQTGNVKTTGITVNTRNVTLSQNQSFQLTFVVAPFTSKDKLSYKTANKKIATVSGNGKITAKKAGKTTITVKSGKKSVKVTVNVIGVKTTGLSVNTTQLNLKVKKKAIIKAYVTPKNSSEKVTYKSSNKKIATVDAKGKVTAKKAGIATITVTSGSKSVKVNVTVTK